MFALQDTSEFNLPERLGTALRKKKKKVSQRGREKLSVIFYSFPETLQLVLPREIVPRGFAFPPALPTRGRFRRCVGGGSGCAAPRALQLRAAQRGGDGERGPARGTLRGAPRVRSGRATRAKKIIITINNTLFLIKKKKKAGPAAAVRAPNPRR